MTDKPGRPKWVVIHPRLDAPPDAKTVGDLPAWQELRQRMQVARDRYEQHQAMVDQRVKNAKAELAMHPEFFHLSDEELELNESFLKKAKSIEYKIRKRYAWQPPPHPSKNSSE